MENGGGSSNQRQEDMFRAINAGILETRQMILDDKGDLADSINNLATSIDEFKKLFKKAVPIDMVAYMFLILVLAIAGIEGVRTFIGIH